MGFKKRLFIFLLIILILALLAYYYPYLTGMFVSNNNINYPKEPAILLRVIDGDTIETDLGTIRLLGINTPEKGKPFYNEAKSFLRQFENYSIELLRDKTDLDKYNRKLRYVFVNNRILNVEILENGLATSFMIDELKYKDKLQTAEKLAKDNEIGLWKRSNDICANCIVLQELNPKEEFFIIKNNCDFTCNLEGWTVKDDANHFFYINNLNGFETSIYNSKNEIWNNNGDRFFMRDEEGMLVVFYEY